MKIELETCMRCIREAGQDPEHRTDSLFVHSTIDNGPSSPKSVVCPRAYTDRADYIKHGDLAVVGQKPPAWCPYRTVHQGERQCVNG